MHIAASKTETAIFVKDCQSAKWRVKNQGQSPVGSHLVNLQPMGKGSLPR